MDINKKDKMIQITLILLVVISLMINFVVYVSNTDPCRVAATVCEYNFANKILSSNWFGYFFWIENILTWIVSITYIVIAIKSKKEVLLKLSFSIFAILTTVVVYNILMNFVTINLGL